MVIVVSGHRSKQLNDQQAEQRLQQQGQTQQQYR
jgi:hypothetical protein